MASKLDGGGSGMITYINTYIQYIDTYILTLTLYIHDYMHTCIP